MDDNTSDCATADVHYMLADLRLAIEKHLPEVDGGLGSYWVTRVESAGSLIARTDAALHTLLRLDEESRNVSVTAECGRLTRELADARTKIAGMTVTLQSSRASRDAYIAELRGDLAARPSLSVALEGTAAGAIARKRMRNTLAAWDKATKRRDAKPKRAPSPTSKPAARKRKGAR